MTPAPGLTVPFARFRDTHLAHHHDPVLTDPYDDPETNFLDPAVWARLPRAVQALLGFNNTLVGRIVAGPLIGSAVWARARGGADPRGEGTVRRDWAVHAAGLVPVAAWLWVAAMPLWAYLLEVWVGHGLLKIRTFLEHRAHEAPRARTVIVEDRGPLALLFLNNNFHAVHHMHPKVPVVPPCPRSMPPTATTTCAATRAMPIAATHRSFAATSGRPRTRCRTRPTGATEAAGGRCGRGQRPVAQRGRDRGGGCAGGRQPREETQAPDGRGTGRGPGAVVGMPAGPGSSRADAGKVSWCKRTPAQACRAGGGAVPSLPRNGALPQSRRGAPARACGAGGCRPEPAAERQAAPGPAWMGAGPRARTRHWHGVQACDGDSRLRRACGRPEPGLRCRRRAPPPGRGRD